MMQLIEHEILYHFERRHFTFSTFKSVPFANEFNRMDFEMQKKFFSEMA